MRACFATTRATSSSRETRTAEVPGAVLDRDAVGRTLARLVAVCDLLHEESKPVLGDWGKATPSVTSALLTRYAAEVAELVAPAVAELDGPADPVT